MRSQRTRLVSRVLPLALLALNIAKSSPADTLYSNLGPPASTCPPCRFTINAAYDTNFSFLATTFETTAGGDLDSILLPVFSLTDPITFGLYTNSDDHPGTLLEDWSVAVPGFPAELETLASVLNPSIDAGTQYWFVITNPSADAVSWYENNQGATGGIWLGNSLNSFLEFVPGSPTAAIELDSIPATATPEPASEATAAIGLLIMGLALAKKRRLRW